MTRAKLWIPATLIDGQLVAREPWRAWAACDDHPVLSPTAWDDSPIGRETPADRALRIAPAIAVCRNECPVREECWEAVDLKYDEGVRGGRDLRAEREAETNRKAASWTLGSCRECGHRLRDHVEPGGCCIGDCPCLAAS